MTRAAAPRAGPPQTLPTGTVTFLLTDVEESTRLWEAATDAMSGAMARHNTIAHEAIARHGGVLPKDQGEGDSVFAAFGRATDAVACTLHLQQSLAGEPWPGGLAIRVRMALHTGEAELRDGNYLGPAVNRAARLRAIAHGGQTILSQATCDLVVERLPDRASLQDLGSHRLRDLGLPEHVYQLCHPDLPREFPPLRSLDALPNNLPLQLTNFIGRDQEIAAVKKNLSAARLLTLTGAGGVGKTRLALQVAADLLEEYPDGVWLVDLAPVSDPDLVAQAALQALGVREPAGATLAPGPEADPEQPGRGSVETLVDHLRVRTTLVLLDNCEHLVAACAALAERLLTSCPNLTVLVTTREPLGVTGETSRRVPSLEMPDPKHLPPAEAVAQYEAVRLFSDRATMGQADFLLSDESAPAVAQICHRLDGIPLALELAAAKVKVLTPQEIASRLDDQFRLLAGRRRGGLSRQETLRATVDWSYRLLTEEERALLLRLSVFAGGFTLDSAEEVCTAGVVEAGEVLELLAHLVDKSLVLKETRGAASRYRLLETIRQYAREKLEPQEVTDVRGRHRDFYVDLAEEAAPHLPGGPRQREWLDLLEEEHDNLRLALDWSIDDADPEAALRLAGALFHFWWVRGYVTEGRRRLDEALSREGTVDPKVRATALFAAGFLAHAQYDFTTSQALSEQCLDLSREAGFKWGISGALFNLGIVASWLRAPEEARSLLEEGLAIGRELGDKFQVGISLFWLANLAWGRGDPAAARPRLEESLAVATDLGSKLGISRCLSALARLEHDEGRYAEAHLRYEEALALSRDLGDKAGTAVLLARLAGMAQASGEDEEARSMRHRASEIVRENRDPAQIANLALVIVDQGHYDEARKLLEEMLALYRISGDRGTVAAALNFVGWTAYLEGDLAGARPVLEESVSIIREFAGEVSVNLLVAMSFHSLAEVERAQGNYSEARSLLEEALEAARETGRPILVSASLHALGEIARAEGDLPRASVAHCEGLELIREGGNTSYVAESLEGLAGVAAAEGNHDRAARIFGAAEAMRERVPAPLPPVARPGYERDVALVRKGMGEEAFTAAWEEGRATPVREALDYGLSGGATHRNFQAP